MKKMDELFSYRYRNVFSSTDFPINSEIYEELLQKLCTFDARHIEYPDRYSSYNVVRTTFDYAKERLNEFYTNMGIDDKNLSRAESAFDWIEVVFLINNDKDLPVEINEIFENNDLPWRLINGKIAKIDSKQFEQDLLHKQTKELEKLSGMQPKFANAYKELIEAKECFDNRNYKLAILCSEKSYESILKIVANQNNGQADTLINQVKSLLEVPSSMSINGFCENVLKSLPYIRNQTKVGHGEGGENIEVPQSLARLAINLSCALSSYLLDNLRNESIKDQN